MSEKILLVDDEPNVLEGYQRLMRRDFAIEIAPSGAAALACMEHNSFAVVVSDMRMPEMDGIQFLTQVKTLSPDTIRIMLTGNSDLDTAIHAVNDGNIFRFLTKPCTKELMGKTLTAALIQHRLVVAEKDLLERTLSGSIQVLTEVLSLVNPAAFSRAARVRRYIHHIVTTLSLGSPWRFEVAAMMSQLGCVTLHPETVEAVYAGRRLPPEEQKRFDAHPQIASDLLSNIPRMEPIAWMIARQHLTEPIAAVASADHEMAQTMRLGAEILRVTLAFDEMRSRGSSKAEAIHSMASRFKGIDPRILHALSAAETDPDQKTTRTCPIDDLAIGMILEEEVRTTNGLLIVAKGQEVTFPLILKLKNFYERGAVGGSIVVTVPSAMHTSAAAATT